MTVDTQQKIRKYLYQGAYLFGAESENTFIRFFPNRLRMLSTAPSTRSRLSSYKYYFISYLDYLQLSEEVVLYTSYIKEI